MPNTHKKKDKIEPAIDFYKPLPAGPIYQPKSDDGVTLSIILDGKQQYKGPATGNLTATRSGNDWNMTNGGGRG